MRTADILCLIMTHKKDEMEIVGEDRFSPGDKMVKKSSKMESRPQQCKASRAVGRPRKRWEEYMNQFVKPEETEETNGNDLNNNDTWIRVAKDQIKMERHGNRMVLKFIEMKGIPASDEISSSPSVYKVTIAITTSDGIVADAKRAGQTNEPLRWKEPSTSAWSLPSQRCS